MSYCAFCDDDDEVFADYEQPKPSRLQRIKHRIVARFQGPPGPMGPMGDRGDPGKDGVLRVVVVAPETAGEYVGKHRWAARIPCKVLMPAGYNGPRFFSNETP